MGDTPAQPAYSIKLSKEAFTFCSAHFITYAGDVCEPLHGHNYRTTVELSGPLDENAYVLDFVATRDAVAGIIAELDHRVLLPTEHPSIRVAETEGPEGRPEVTASYGDRRWVFPREDCRLLPIKNTTAELLARWIGERLMESLRQQGFEGVLGAVIEVDECDGQVGVCRLSGL